MMVPVYTLRPRTKLGEMEVRETFIRRATALIKLYAGLPGTLTRSADGAGLDMPIATVDMRLRFESFTTRSGPFLVVDNDDAAKVKIVLDRQAAARCSKVHHVPS